MKNGYYFNRVYSPCRGWPKQSGLDNVDSETRIQWNQHVSNIIPALGAKRQELAEDRDSDVTGTALLLNAGVTPELICDPLSPETVEGLIESVSAFVAKRWALDNFV